MLSEDSGSQVIEVGKGGRAMKCPLLSAGEYTRNVSHPTISCDCIKEECAWWNEAYSCCQLVELVHALGGIELHLKEIKEKIAHERLV